MTTRTMLQSLALRCALGLGIGLLVVVLTRVADLGLLKDVELFLVDYRFQQRGVSKLVSEQGNVVIVDVSDVDTLALPEPFPFPRSYYAHLIDNLNRAGARTIVLNVVFDGPFSGDDSLRAVLSRYDNVVLAVRPRGQEMQGKYLVRSPQRDYANVFYESDRRVGANTIPVDRDAVVRRYLPSVWSSGYLTPSLAFGALNHAYRLPADSVVQSVDKAFLFSDRQIPEADDESFMLNYYGPARTFRFVPFSQVIDDEDFWTKDELDIEEQINAFDENLMQVFSNKVVIVGSTMPREREMFAVPMTTSGGRPTMESMEIHATAIQNVIDRNFVQATSGWFEFSVVIVGSLLTFLGVLAIKSIRGRSRIVLELLSVLLVLLFLVCVVELAVLQFSGSSVLMNVVNPSLAILSAYVGTIVYQAFSRRREESVLRSMFNHFMSSEAVERLVANPALARLGGERRSLTVLFTDIADFTTISEPLPAEKLVQFLNEYHDEMAAIVFKHGGTLDKFEGDATVAFWGAPLPCEDHAKRACMCALEMLTRLDQLRPRWQRTGKPAVEVRSGIYTDTMVVGNVGGRERYDYTVVGSGVALAARLQAENKRYRSRIIIGDSTYQQLKESVIARDLDLLLVKGNSEPVHIWELLSTSETPLNEPQQQSLDAYHEGLRLYRDRKWNEAIACMQQAKSLDPTCQAAEMYEQRASLYKLNPPPEGWNGVFLPNSK